MMLKVCAKFQVIIYNTSEHNLNSESDTSSIFSSQFDDLDNNKGDSDVFTFNYETSDTEETTDDDQWLSKNENC